MNSEVNFALFADGTIGLDALVQLVSDKITDPEPQSADQLSELFRMFDRVSMILNILYWNISFTFRVHATSYVITAANDLWGKVMFLHLSVSHSIHNGGCLPRQTPPLKQTLPRQTPLGRPPADTPPKQTSPRQPLTSRHSPGGHCLGRPPGRHCPQDRHPLGRHPLWPVTR